MYLDDYKRWLAADLLDCDLNAELQSIGVLLLPFSLVPQVFAAHSAQAQTA